MAGVASLLCSAVRTPDQAAAAARTEIPNNTLPILRPNRPSRFPKGILIFVVRALGQAQTQASVRQAFRLGVVQSAEQSPASDRFIPCSAYDPAKACKKLSVAKAANRPRDRQGGKRRSETATSSFRALGEGWLSSLSASPNADRSIGYCQGSAAQPRRC